MNFLYCFDENYNKQAFTSIISLLDNVYEKINIFVIHDKKLLNNEIPSKILNHQNLNIINLYEFNNREYFFPNLEGSHVSEATYYRLFLDNYLDNDIEKLVYLDADTVCLGNPLDLINLQFEDLLKSNKLIAARTELKKSKIENYETVGIYAREYPFERLGIDENYFNAGVMLIDYKSWQKENMKEKLLKNLNILKNEVITWDQDILNSVVNGNYQELDKKFNFFDKDVNKGNDDDILFIHYLGSHKPWSSSGIYNYSAKFYHTNFYKLFNTYHLQHSWKKLSIKNLVKALLNGKFLNIDKKIIYFKHFIKSLIK